MEDKEFIDRMSIWPCRILQITKEKLHQVTEIDFRFNNKGCHAILKFEFEPDMIKYVKQDFDHLHTLIFWFETYHKFDK